MRGAWAFVVCAAVALVAVFLLGRDREHAEVVQEQGVFIDESSIYDGGVAEHPHHVLQVGGARASDAGVLANLRTDPDAVLLARDALEAKRLRTLACVEGDVARCDDELFEFLLGHLANDPGLTGLVASLDSSFVAASIDASDVATRAVALAALRAGVAPSTPIPAPAMVDPRRSVVERVAWSEIATTAEREWTSEHQRAARQLARTHSDARLVRGGVRASGARGGVETSRLVHELPTHVLERGSVRRDAAWALSQCGMTCLRDFAVDGFRSPLAAEIFVDAVRGSDFERDAEALQILRLAEAAHVGDTEISDEIGRAR